MLPCAVVLAAGAAAAAAGSARRLIETSPTERRWVAEEELMRMAGAPGDRGWMDITDSRNVTAKLRASAIPTNPVHEDYVRAAISTISGDQGFRTIDHLQQYFTRYYTTDTGVEAAHWIAGQYRDAAGSRTDVHVDIFEHTWAQPSVIATVLGTGKGAPSKETVVLGGHLDSIRIPGQTGRAPGADDSGSQCATVLQAFRVLMAQGFKPARTVEFQVYAAEEVGLRGSQAIAEAYAAEGRDVVSMLNFDLECRVNTEDLADPHVGIITDYADPALSAFMRTLIETYNVNPPKEGQRGYAASDHASFCRAGYPCAWVRESNGYGNPDRHTAEDTMDKCNQTHWVEMTKVAVSYAVEMGCDPSTASCT